jgi:hypothetical protein
MAARSTEIIRRTLQPKLLNQPRNNLIKSPLSQQPITLRLEIPALTIPRASVTKHKASPKNPRFKTSNTTRSTSQSTSLKTSSSPSLNNLNHA